MWKPVLTLSILTAAAVASAWLPARHSARRISRLQLAAGVSQTTAPPARRNATSEDAIGSSSAAPFFLDGTVTTRGPDPATKPDYDSIVGPLGRTVDHLFLRVFRSKLAEQVGVDSSRNATDFLAVPELAAALNSRYATNTTEIQQRAVQTLVNLFPSWLPGSYAVLFSRPFPAFAARMNAWATWVAGTWLMGECEINDVVVVIDSNMNTTTLPHQGLLVKRCRFLEESGCASVCVNSCKIPTQTFFAEHMGLPLLMEPDYETFECQFSFGVAPTAATEAAALATPCLALCPTAGSLRRNHHRRPEQQQQCTMMTDQEVRIINAGADGSSRIRNE